MTFRKALGTLFIFISLIGIAVCIYGIYMTWQVRAGITTAGTDNLALLGDTVDTTRDGLEVVGQVLDTTTENLELVTTSVHTLTLAMQDTNLILGSLADLTGTSLPDTISAAQTSLESAQASALLIDNVLSAITSFPLLGMDAYRPEVPLNVALGEISTSLDPLVPSLEDVSAGLDGASTNLDALETQLAGIADTGDAIETALSDAGAVIGDYQEILAEVALKIDLGIESFPGWTASVAWTFTALFGLLLFSQFGLLDRGLAIVREPADAAEAPVERPVEEPADAAAGDNEDDEDHGDDT